jgi:hypothetical protein
LSRNSGPFRRGEKNEENAAYFLDFHLKDSQNWVVNHDLRIEHRGKAAQIDHLVVGRFLYMFVLESKSFSYGIETTPEGEFLRWNGKAYQGIESPIEQNNQHIFAMITYRNVVLISPKSKIEGNRRVGDRPKGGSEERLERGNKSVPFSASIINVRTILPQVVMKIVAALFALGENATIHVVINWRMTLEWRPARFF